MIKQICPERGSKDIADIRRLETKHGFKYRILIGSFIFGMITCNLDIVSILTILAYFSDCPANIHFVVLKSVSMYIQGPLNE